MYLRPESLSPDPTCGREVTHLAGNRCGMDLFPFRLIRVSPQAAKAAAWAARLDIFRDPGELMLTPDVHGRADLLIDFGTELDACLELCLSTGSSCNVTATFGESAPEAEGLIPGGMPRPDLMWHVPDAGAHSHRFDAIKIFGRTIEGTVRGFRYVRLLFHDVRDKLTVRRLVAHAEFTFTERRGDFRCSDRRLQRVWQSSVYTARLCTRPDAFWDGIKRDRMGWFGDARITKGAVDAVFLDPRPAEEMFSLLPTDDWGNGIPNYSFDAIDMLKQHVLTFGLDAPVLAGAYARIAELLAWVKRTQTDDGGFIVRTDRSYFGDIGFLDWSPMPVGGRLEELSWLQCKYVEGLRNAARIARWLGKAPEAEDFEAEAHRLAERIIDTFWRQGVGFVHTLNHVGPVRNPRLPGGDGHYRKTYVEKIALGPSGPSRQANALAIWAEVCSPEMCRTILDHVFNNEEVPSVITPYFAYYEQAARAECGDPVGALERMRDYIGGMLEREDAATIWELYDPEVTDLRKYYSHLELGWDWPLSLCHGWGSGAVTLVTRHVLGTRPTRPGFGAIAIAPALEMRCAFDATVPTPRGPIRVKRLREQGRITYIIPREIDIDGIIPDGVAVQRA